MARNCHLIEVVWAEEVLCVHTLEFDIMEQLGLTLGDPIGMLSACEIVAAFG